MTNAIYVCEFIFCSSYLYLGQNKTEKGRKYISHINRDSISIKTHTVIRQHYNEVQLRFQPIESLLTSC